MSDGDKCTSVDKTAKKLTTIINKTGIKTANNQAVVTVL